MYSFRDTTATQASDSVKPSEALKINGVYIEDVVPGYRTLNVTGREAMTPEIDMFDTGIRETVAWYLDNAWWWQPIRAQRYAGERLGKG